jgi:hypothetical protein
MEYVYSDYRMYLQDKIRKEAVGIIWRDGLYLLVPLFSCLSLERDVNLNILDFCYLLLMHVFRSAGGFCLCLCKRKAVPLQAWSGPVGSRKLRFSDFTTTAQDGGKVVSLTHRPPLPPGNIPGTHFC